ncbi:CPBP family intramembrane metalloprotease [Vibrio sp. J1-1]|uniref:CPBP family intramembrane glutamic endopeptidase n=1 Tax=Vibrio sp. J1-1 TaxID=2912251 RepID=UPI001F33D770|nr:CPBP family intramembrane glutamic endopeptidase [Vibrio sp. J1-1]MCF7480258.1 CPBP family intramembrane metalloprotease [Vibrio sp. J1-1]
MLLDGTVWVCLPLLVAIAMAFTRHQMVSLLLVIVTLVGALIVKRLEFIAFITSLFVLATADQLPRLANNQPGKWIYYCGWALVLSWCAMLFTHIIPGFHNLQVLDDVKSGPQSIPFSMYLNLDKPLAFFALLFAYPKLLGEAKRVELKSLLFILVPLLGLLPVASSFGALKSELSLPDWWWLFAVNNLMITCVAEEALFRGWIQQSLSRRFSWKIGVAVASTLFGFAHIAGGGLLVVFAALAGLGYGLIFHVTGRLWCAVLAHFLFNFVHLVFFTYPAVVH